MHPLGRESCIQLVVEHIGRTRVGRELGLARLQSVADFRATIPLHDRQAHFSRVEQNLGFGVVDAADPDAPDLVGAQRERESVLDVWRSALAPYQANHVVWMRAPEFDRAVDEIVKGDLAALGATLTRVERADDAATLLARLERAEPDVLVVPSLLTVSWLERVHHVPLERRLRRLRLILAEHDFGRTVRSRVKVASAGWVHASGRLALPSATAPVQAATLACGSSFIELLPHVGDEDGRRLYAHEAILPEHAQLGGRYELVVTSPLGFLRLRTEQHVRVVGFDPPSSWAPFARPRIVHLPPAPAEIQLAGCTLWGAWLTASVRQAFQREDPALVAAEIAPALHGEVELSFAGSMRMPELLADTELGALPGSGTFRTSRRARGLQIRLEVQGQAQRELAARLSLRIDEDLCRRSPAYAYLRSRNDLFAPKVIIVAPHTHEAELEVCVQRLFGSAWLPDIRTRPAED